MPKRHTTITLSVIVALSLIVAISVITNTKMNSENVATTTPTTSSTTTAETSTATPSTSTSDTAATATTSTYKDGTYTEEGSYSTPGGTESIKVTVTLASDKVTATSTVSEGRSGDSKEYQSEFIDNYESLVVGKSLDSVSLSRVSGSSLTSKGFNSALAKIKADAKA